MTTILWLFVLMVCCFSVFRIGTTIHDNDPPVGSIIMFISALSLLVWRLLP